MKFSEQFEKLYGPPVISVELSELNSESKPGKTNKWIIGGLIILIVGAITVYTIRQKQKEKSEKQFHS